MSFIVSFSLPTMIVQHAPQHRSLKNSWYLTADIYTYQVVHTKYLGLQQYMPGALQSILSRANAVRLFCFTGVIFGTHVFIVHCLLRVCVCRRTGCE